jgi:hypothetical protein
MLLFELRENHLRRNTLVRADIPTRDLNDLKEKYQNVRLCHLAKLSAEAGCQLYEPYLSLHVRCLIFLFDC